MSADLTLFGGLTIPSLHSSTLGDNPRARRGDPVTSHMAGDRSQSSVTAVKRELLVILRRRGSLTGSEANTLYREAANASDGHLPVVAWDSPRKRLGELARDGLVVPVDEKTPRGTEMVFVLPDSEKEIAA